MIGAATPRPYSRAPGKQFKKLLDKSSVKPFEEAMGLAMSAVVGLYEYPSCD